MQLSNKTIDWHGEQWREVLAGGVARLPHALLLSGMAGLGKRLFANQLLALQLCESPAEQTGLPLACGECSGCRWLAADSHPDYRCISPDGDEGDDAEPTENAAAAAPKKAKKRSNAQIRIDAIRSLEDFVFVGSHRQGRRVIIITDADAMNAAAANALLKILEEPPASVYFILITENIKRLLPTMRSRCRVINFVRPQPSQATAWLQQAGLPNTVGAYLALAGGAPLQVAQWHESGQLPGLEALLESFRRASGDPLALAAFWDGLLKKDEHLKLDFLVDSVQRWVFDNSLSTAGATAHFGISSAASQQETSALPKALFPSWRELLRLRRSARHPLNQLLFLEDLATHSLRALGKLQPAR